MVEQSGVRSERNPQKGMTRSKRRRKEVGRYEEEKMTLAPHNPPSLLSDAGGFKEQVAISPRDRQDISRGGRFLAPGST